MSKNHTAAIASALPATSTTTDKNTTKHDTSQKSQPRLQTDFEDGGAFIAAGDATVDASVADDPASS